MRETARKWILEKKIIAILRGLAPETLLPLAEALLEGGIGLIEVTFDASRPDTWEQTARAIRLLDERFAGGILPGAGTVLRPDQAAMARDAGARYIISPNTDADVIAKTRALGMLSLPGAFTPTEIVAAHSAGADFVKVFPADAVGPAYIAAVKAPLPHIPLMAVGGVSDANVADFLRAGAAGVGVGGSLARKDWIAEGAFDRIKALARRYVEAAEGR